MFGWRRRIGYIAPTVTEVVAYDFYRFAPDGIGLTSVSCGIDNWDPAGFESGLIQVSGFAEYLGQRGVDYIIHGGGPLVVAQGGGYEETIVQAIGVASGVAATTGVRAAKEALRHVGARRIVIASPYPENNNQAMARYLADDGFEIVRAEGLDLEFKALQDLPPNQVYRFIRGVAERAGAGAGAFDAIYLPCPQWLAAPVVPALELDFGVPVIAYTHATFFTAFRALGMRDAIEGHGRLLASLATARD